MRINTKVCFIGGAGHSGSTLLGLVLGAHPRVLYAGEANKSRGLGDASVKLRKRTCKVCGESCRVWSGLEARLREIDLYEALSERTSRPIVVDSTKSIAWIDEQIAALGPLGVALHFFLLGRDGRAVLASSLRKRPETEAAEHARTWARQIEATEALAARFPGPVTRVRYERLATRPSETIAAVTSALQLEPSPAMLEPWTAEQHPLGGNAGTQSLLSGGRTAASGDIAIGGDKRAYYAEHPRGFRLDLRWKTELSAEALAAFEDVAGATNRAYAWNEDEKEVHA
jgi:hypothetical protein